MLWVGVEQQKLWVVLIFSGNVLIYYFFVMFLNYIYPLKIYVMLMTAQKSFVLLQMIIFLQLSCLVLYSYTISVIVQDIWKAWHVLQQNLVIEDINILIVSFQICCEG